MKQNVHNIQAHSTDYHLPSGLKSAKALAEMAYMPLPEDKILEYASAGYMPHYVVDGADPLFHGTEAKEWVEHNLIRAVAGKELDFNITVISPELKNAIDPPVSISAVKNLCAYEWGTPSGVYFLCKDDEVVYIGQSTKPAARIAQHESDGKKFDRVFFLPVPQSGLNDVEGALIRAIEPKLNGRTRGRMIAPGHACNRDDESVLKKVGLGAQASITSENSG